MSHDLTFAERKSAYLAGKAALEATRRKIDEAARKKRAKLLPEQERLDREFQALERDCPHDEQEPHHLQGSGWDDQCHWYSMRCRFCGKSEDRSDAYDRRPMQPGSSRR